MGELKHGFEEQYRSDEYMSMLAKMFYLYYDFKRHNSSGNPRPELIEKVEWRMKDRQRTVSAALVLCLNLGVDPPDVIKTNPCSRMEAWLDPTTVSDTKKAIESIGKRLNENYETLSSRTRYKLSLDPTVEDAKRFCQGLRRGAKEERILYHYNGHGVPRPTQSGEIWVFNKGYTQYIPVSLYDLQTWLGAPCIFVWDCHSAGNIVNSFNRYVQKRIEDEKTKPRDPAMPLAVTYLDCIQLAACEADEILPMHPDLPADLFTSCLTSPIETSVRFFLMGSPLKHGHLKEINITGKCGDRRTALGELNWIFTAITDTIAWSILPKYLFKRLFRQDLMVAALSRNFLLAQRIMRQYNCHPISEPKIPATYMHSLWDAWDLAIEQFVVQLINAQNSGRKIDSTFRIKNSTFFEEQLTAFEVWLKYSAGSMTPPEQLPVVLQVLLSQAHRLRALVLLSKFLDLGPWAVYSALEIGIFPYVLKLLQSPAPDLRGVLVFIWSRIMSVDYKNIQHELLKDNGYAYFIQILIPYNDNSAKLFNSPEDLKALCAFVISLFCRKFKQGQRVCMGSDLLRVCVEYAQESKAPLLRKWACLCISQLWDDYSEGRWIGMKEKAPLSLLSLLNDRIVEVRASCVVALSTFIGQNDGNEVPENIKTLETQLATSILSMTNDASSVVRKEVVVFFSKFVKQYLNYFIVGAYSVFEEEVTRFRDQRAVDEVRKGSPAYGTVYIAVWRSLLILSVDPSPEVKDFATNVVDFVVSGLEKNTDLAKNVESMLLFLKSKSMRSHFQNNLTEEDNLQRSRSSTTNNSSHNTVVNKGFQEPQSRTASNPVHNSNSPSKKTRSVSLAVTLQALQKFVLGDSWTDTASPRGDQRNGMTNGKSPYMRALPYGAGLVPKSPRSKRTSAEDEPQIDISSGFFDWCCELFQEPYFHRPENDEAGSERHLENVWRKNRNEQIFAETQPQKELALNGTWNTIMSNLHNVSQPKKLLFAQFEPHLIASDDRDGITVWDWSQNKKLLRFSNSNPQKSTITELKLVNEDDVPILMAGSSDGVVKLYKNYDDESKVEHLASWRALTDIPAPSPRSSGLVAEWQQSRGALLVGGDVKIFKIWDAQYELCIADIPARSPCSVTSITSDQVAGNLFIAGFDDGSLRVYDRRLDNRESLVRMWRGQHESKILKVRMQRGGLRELVSGSVDGNVCIWDIRASEPLTKIRAHREIGAIDVHEHAPIIATGFRHVRTFSTFNGESLTQNKNPSGNVIQYSKSHLTDLAFHPHRMIMAVNNSQDSAISIINCLPSLKHTFV
ncbi:hypothetical protein NADFUDRAFT_19895 [Nadsonia fulvescens var. elongata DSM 6958]|uniref:Raptor N-terminal CASPase-like domain-containing protein n=1 Tax=Nadsonia fulvescens var. elongata DSM 6958 TaxID=857566 RepID=A0A1E3PQJ5_9ASCO|nr:hypothetical protein NADFUDRAFT_19895 [Nadsonia fulvescens var. elongata DSM 6958]